MRLKVYLVQRARDDGTIDPEILAAKLTHAAAHEVARRYAPARIVSLVADKSLEENGEAAAPR